MSESSIGSGRRFYLLKRFAAVDTLSGLDAVWRAKQEQTPATALAPGFPFLSRLQAAGYSAVEDLTGATARELILRAGLNRREANAVLAAMESL